MVIPTNQEFLRSLGQRLADAERLASDARSRGDEALAKKKADEIADEWRQMIVRADGREI